MFGIQYEPNLIETKYIFTKELDEPFFKVKKPDINKKMSA